MSTPPAERHPSLHERFSNLGRDLKLRRGEVLFHQQDPADAVFWVQRGRLRLDRHLTNGQLITLSVARAPAMIAEAALFSERYHCRAVAEVASLVSAAPKALVVDLLEKDATFAIGFVRALAKEVRTLRQLLELRNVRPASQRLLSYLALKEDQGEPPADRPLAALASELGLTPETLYRILASLERERLIERQGRRVRLTRQKKT